MKDRKNSSPALPERRSFLSKIWLGLGFVALAEYVTGGFGFLVSGRNTGPQDSPVQIIEAGDISEFIAGTVTFIHAGNCYLSRLEDGGMLAISRRCTHLGCAVPWVAKRNQFECPCHASIFDISGNVIKSPAPRALDLYPITFKQNMVMIDIAHPVKRKIFAHEQLVYPQGQG